MPFYAFFAKTVSYRHYPTCQNGKALDWLDRQLRRQLPGHHFIITFTVPESVRPFMRTHQKQAYTALFKASSQSIKKLSNDKKHIGGGIHLYCPDCGGKMHYRYLVLPYMLIDYKDGG